MASTHKQESDRIREEFHRREREMEPDFYALHRPGNLFVRHGQERALLTALIRSESVPLGDKRILEIGCGRGQWFVTFETLGARRDKLAGIELDVERGQACAERFPHADIRIGDATQLPWDDGALDIVFQSTVFTSVLDDQVKQRLAQEMLRVVKQDGVLLWYDLHRNNPRNPNVRGIGRREIARLFPSCYIWLRRATLAPPIARKVVPVSSTIATLLESLNFLNTHNIGYIKKPG